METCEACGMPMEKKEDHGGGDPKNKWCRHCCKKDGAHKPLKEIREGMISFVLSEEGKEMLSRLGSGPITTKEEAVLYVDAYLNTLPAWNRDA